MTIKEVLQKTDEVIQDIYSNRHNAITQAEKYAYSEGYDALITVRGYIEELQKSEGIAKQNIVNFTRPKNRDEAIVLEEYCKNILKDITGTEISIGAAPHLNLFVVHGMGEWIAYFHIFKDSVEVRYLNLLPEEEKLRSVYLERVQQVVERNEQEFRNLLWVYQNSPMWLLEGSDCESSF